MPWDKLDDTVVHEMQPYNAEAVPAALADHPITPVDAFYSRNHGPIPDVDAGSWRLHIDGLVGRELSLTLEELRVFDAVSVTATLACAGNRRAELHAVRPIPGQHPWGPGAASTAVWRGVRLADVLTAAGVDPAAQHVEFTGPDVAADARPPAPYGCSVPLTKALADEVLLAWEMNGAALPRVHGAPLRVVVPGYIGARSVKWVQRITVRDTPSDNYFQAVAYRMLPPDAEGSGFPLGPSAVNAAILSPADGETVAAGRVRITGYALAGDHRSVGRVDVSVDGGGSWSQAELSEADGAWAWRLWHASVELAGGPTEIVARVWDDAGSTHPERAEVVWNPKGYVNNSWPRIRVTAT